MNEPGNGMNPRCLLKAWDSALTRSTHQKVPKNAATCGSAALVRASCRR
jgi:hypothetical protein